ncbi:hypothetical protein BGZ75_009109 [Mortierella antarctica]|nr:hypothetical protein BGZ75_009109 [Mortierella antarctica]
MTFWLTAVVSFNILNCTVGSGILALAFAIKESGFGLGIVLSIAVAILCWLALYTLIVTGQKIGIYKYAILCEATMGPFGFYLLNGMIFFQTAGACITYMIVIGDTIPIVLSILGWETSRQWVIFLSSIAFILPLLFYRSIGSLARVSMISVMTLPLILFAVAVRGFEYAPEHRRSYDFVGDNVFPAIGVMAFAMLSAQTAFLNFATLAQPTKKAWAQATGIAVSLSWMISFVFAIIGFIAFGEDVEPNIFNSFPLTDGLINAGRGLLGFSMFLTFPQAFYPARDAAHKVLGHEDNVRIPTDKQHFYTTIGLFIPVLACGVFVADLGLLYQLIGGFCSTFLAYIIPASCYFLVFWRKNPITLGGTILKGGHDSYDDSIGPFEGEHGQDRYEDDEDSLEEEVQEEQEQDEEERLLKHKLARQRKSDLALEEAHSRAPLNRTRGQYGAISAPSLLQSTSESLQSGVSLADMAGAFTSSPRRREQKTELWLDISAGVLLVFGVFVMVISTVITIRKMAGY